MCLSKVLQGCSQRACGILSSNYSCLPGITLLIFLLLLAQGTAWPYACGGVIHRRQGHLGLESYPTNARCEWTLRVDQPFTIDLRFLMLSVEFDYSCQYDYVEVRDGDSLNSRVIGRYCGNERPPPIKSTGDSLHILFVSDGYKNFDGFFVSFQESSACISSPCFHDGTCIAESSNSFYCTCLAGYTGKRCEHVLECRTPLSPAHGITKHLDVRVGGHALFSCDPGYTLQGFQVATCLLDGSWSTMTPHCVSDQNCKIPPKPENGDHFLVYGPNDVLIAVQFLCNKPYKLNGTHQRICLSNNTWSGMAPTCVKELDSNPASDKQNSSKPTGEAEKKLQPQKPTSGKDNVGQGVDLDIRKEVEKEKSKDKEANKDTDSSINTIIKKETEKHKDNMKPTDNLDSTEKVAKSTTKGLEVDFVDIVLIDSKRANQTGKNKTTDQKITDGPRYTVLSFTEDDKENIFYKVDSISTENNTESVDSNDIEKSLETTAQQGTEEMQTATVGNNRTEIISTVIKETEKVTNILKKTEMLKVNTVIEIITKEVPPQERKKESQPNAKTEGEFGQTAGTENLVITEGKGGHCPPLAPLYNGYYELVTDQLPETFKFFCNHTYALSGSARRMCQPNGTWTGTQPICLKACREPKVSVLVKQRVLPPQFQARKTAVHKFYSSIGMTNLLNDIRPTRIPLSLPALPHGFHHLYTHIEYECMSQYYKHSGSARRTCLKTGKWSGRHVSCSPVCGKLTNFDHQHPAETNWPWLAAIYRLPASSKPGKHSSVAEIKGKDAKLMEEEIDLGDWQLICSGALVNQRSVVVAAHCITELGKIYPLDTSEIRVLLGKQYRSDLRMTKGLQQLRVSFITLHPNYDPLVLDSDVAILKLLDKARIGDYVLPICLPNAHEITEDSRLGIVTGWSLLSDKRAGDMEKARVGHVKLGDIVQCEQQYASYGVPISVSENMLCGRQGTGFDQSNICPADTGGILILPPVSSDSIVTSYQGMASQEWKLLGLVSFGYDSLNCNPELYTVYTGITNFIEFIEENMK
ncbi:inactive serine protease PAMR1 isoform X4 [Paramisgurnus dabryanus]|uniref:inactive serine protease PAMR1 isoform X4 n=1 Tax=Paramisgurnus dabryanus TaxID=90735 RepID=UPI0031F400B5